MKLRLIFSKIPHIFNLTGNLLESVSLGSAYFAGGIMYRKSTVLITGQHNEMSGCGKNTRSHAADDRTADRKYIDHGIFIQPENASAEPKMLYTIGHQFPFSVQIFIQIAIGTCIICNDGRRNGSILQKTADHHGKGGRTASADCNDRFRTVRGIAPAFIPLDQGRDLTGYKVISDAFGSGIFMFFRIIQHKIQHFAVLESAFSSDFG